MFSRMAFVVRAARPAGAVFVAATGVMVSTKFQPQMWFQPPLISCEEKEKVKIKAAKTASRTKSSKMSKTEADVTHDTALYRAYEEKFGAKKTVQLTFADVAYLLKGIGIKNGYVASRLFQAMDEDHSGTVSYDEMNMFCHTLAMGTRQEKAKFMFDSCDTNDNGKVEVAEMRLMVKNLALVCHQVLPHYVLLKTEADVALCEDFEIDTIATVVSNRLCYNMFKEIGLKKSGLMTFKEFEQWLTRNQPSAQEFCNIFAVFDHLLAK